MDVRSAISYSNYERSLVEMEKSIQRFEQLSPLDRRIALRKHSKHPRRLYKYRGLRTNREIDQTKRDQLKNIVVDNTLWLSRCSDFNDPFDGSVAYNLPTDDGELRDALIQVLVRNGKSAREARTTVSPALIHDRVRLEAMVDGFQDQLIPQIGICCFCATPRNPILWAHYADEHRGVCLQFDVSADLAAFTSLEMEYDDTFPIDTDPFGTRNQRLGFRSFLRKSTDWAYEKEWRKFTTGKSHIPMPFRPEALSGIFFGCRCPEEDQDFVLELIDQRAANGHSRPDLFKVEKAHRRYRFNARSFTCASQS